MSDQIEKKSFFADLWDRRFFQFFATYIAASWGAIQFLEWGVKRYSIPSVWVDKLGLFIVAMLPLVICVIYFHGRPGDDKWLKFEKVFYPINVVGALVMSLFLVNTNAESITEEVTVTDVEGLTIVREVPRQEYNKKVVVFPVEGREHSELWKSIAISELLNNKLEQDMRIIVSSALSISSSYEDYGYETFKDIPFGTKLNISVDNFSDFFVESTYVDGDDKKVNVKIFETLSGEEVGQQIIEGEDVYEIAEKMSAVINQKIKVSEVEGKELFVDLPSNNLISANKNTLQLYTEANMIMSTEPNKTGEIFEKIAESVVVDPTCAECWSMMSYVKLISGQDQSDEMTNALKYAESLPERQQLKIKYFNYLSKNDTEKAVKLCQMWRKLYPQDSKPVSNLLSLYRGLFRNEEAMEVAKQAIDDGHKGSIFITYAELLIQAKEWEQAEIYLNKYKETYPKQFEATSLLVDTYAGKGLTDKALDALDELIIMKPREKSYLLKKATLLSKQNDFDQSINVLQSALQDSDTVSDSIQNMTKQLEVYNRSMDFENFGKLKRKLKATYVRNFPPVQYLQSEYSTIGYYKFIGQTDSIGYHLKKIESKVAPSRRPLVKDVNEFMIKVFMDEPEGLSESYAKVKPMFENMGSKFVMLLYSSEVKFVEGKYEEALKLYAECKKETTDPAMISSNFHEAHLKLEKYEEGLAVVDDILKYDPLNPLLRLYKAQFLDKLNKPDEAKSALQPVIGVFRKGDERYNLVTVAKTLADTLDI